MSEQPGGPRSLREAFKRERQARREAEAEIARLRAGTPPPAVPQVPQEELDALERVNAA